MPLPQKELNQIREGHQIRPYWIANVKADCVTGFYCSSNPIKKCPAASQFVISDVITQIRDSHVDLRKIFRIPFDHMIDPICSVPAAVLNQANKRLILQQRQNSNRTAYRFPVPLIPVPGDLLRSGKLVLNCSEHSCAVVPRCNSDTDGAVGGKISNNIWYFNAWTIQEFSLSELAADDLIGMADWEFLYRIRLHSKKVPTLTPSPKYKQNACIHKSVPYLCGQILEEWGGQQFVFLYAMQTHLYGYVYDDFVPDQVVKLDSSLIVTPRQIPMDQLDDDLAALIEAQTNPQLIQLLQQVQKQKDLHSPLHRCSLPGCRISAIDITG